MIKPENYDIPYQSEKIHGISTALAKEKGETIEIVLKSFKNALSKTQILVGQNLKFDLNIIGSEFHRLAFNNDWLKMPVLDTCTEKTALLCKLPGGRGGKFKLPTLSELHEFLFQKPFEEAHNATADVEATARCFFELVRKQLFSQSDLLLDNEKYAEYFQKNKQLVEPAGIKHINLFKASKSLIKIKDSDVIKEKPSNNIDHLKDYSFSHLHNKTQYSVLQSTIHIKSLIEKAVEFEMPAVAFSDSGNMMGAFHFVETAYKHNSAIEMEIEELVKKNESSDDKILKLKNKKILPIVGCEFQVCHDRNDKSYKDNGYQIPFLAKNKNGYQNLIKLSSIVM